MSEFAKRLRLTVAESGLKQIDIAKTCGVSPPTVSGWLSGKFEPSRKHLASIARATGSSVAYLLGEDSSQDEDARAALLVELLGTELAERALKMPPDALSLVFARALSTPQEGTRLDRSLGPLARLPIGQLEMLADVFMETERIGLTKPLLDALATMLDGIARTRMAERKGDKL